MKKKAIAASVVFVAPMLYVFALLCSGQTQARLPNSHHSDELTLRSNTRLVQVYATITDFRGRPVPGVAASQIRLSEDGIPQTISIFRQEDAPVSLGLLVDNSGSMRDKRKKVEAAVLAMVRISNSNDEVFAINFSDSDRLRSRYPFTHDLAELERELAPKHSQGGSAIREALHTGILNMAAESSLMKRVLVVITDGEDNESHIGIAQVIDLAQKANTIVYAIGLFARSEPINFVARAHRELNRITRSTGGRTYYPELKSIPGVTEAIAREIRSQYTIGYYPNSTAPLDGKFHRIELAANGLHAWRIRARKGYFALAAPVSGNTSIPR